MATSVGYFYTIIYFSSVSYAFTVEVNTEWNLELVANLVSMCVVCLFGSEGGIER
jgi:hypothetical protein